jgi:hypothetical protein
MENEFLKLLYNVCSDADSDMGHLYERTDEALTSAHGFSDALYATTLSADEKSALEVLNIEGRLAYELQGFMNGFRLGMKLARELTREGGAA